MARAEHDAGRASSWSTSSFADGTDTSPGALSALGEHLDDCRRLNGRLFRLRCGFDTLHGFVSGRFVTTLAVLALAAGAIALFS